MTTLTAAHAARRRGQGYAFLAVVAWSTAGLFQREVSAGIVAQLGGRALIGALTLLAWLAATEDGGPWRALRRLDRPGWDVAICVTVAQLTFIVALNHTTVAEVLLFQAVSPLMAAGLAVLFLGERVQPRTWIAMAVALCGVGLMVGGGTHPTLLGDGAGAVMALCFAGMIVLTRRRHATSSAPAVCVAQFLICSMALAATVYAPHAVLDGARAADAGWLVLLGVIQVGVGFGAFTVSARLLPVAELALITLIEVVLGPAWVWLSVGERPDAATVAGGAIALAAVGYQAGGAALRR